MPYDSQAQADLNEEPLVDDPLDASNDPNKGATELDSYENAVREIDMELSGQVEAADEENADSQESADEAAPSDGEETETEIESGDEPDEDEGNSASKSERFRFKDEDDKAVAAIARGKGISLVEAARIYSGEAVSTTKVEAKAEPETPVVTVASISDQIKDLRTKRAEASTALEFESAEELQNQIDALIDQRDDLRHSEREQQSGKKAQEARQFEEAYTASENKAVQFYPDTANPNSEMVKRMIAMDERMLASEDPIYDHPDKPFILAKAAAKELGIIMADPAKASQKGKSSPTTRRPIQPASGSARTAATNAPARTKDAIEGIGDLADYEKFVASAMG